MSKPKNAVATAAKSARTGATARSGATNPSDADATAKPSATPKPKSGRKPQAIARANGQRIGKRKLPALNGAGGAAMDGMLNGPTAPAQEAAIQAVPPGDAPTNSASSNEVSANGAAANGASTEGTALAGAPANAATVADWEKSQEWAGVWLAVAHIEPNPYQPRLEFNKEEMDELVASVKAHGVLQPVTVRTLPAPNFQLVAGERRLRACKAAGRKRIPAIVRDDLTDAEVAELALVENVQRARLNPMEAARGYKRLMLEFRHKEERIAKRMGLSMQSVKDAIRLLQLPDSVQQIIAVRRLTPAHGQALLRLVRFPLICEMVATYTADHAVTAKALDADLLPNATVLKSKGWIESLDWRTKFNWKAVCGTCPLGAFVSVQGSGYCLKPAEWKAKNAAAIELQNQEAACVLEAARQDQSQTVESEALPRMQYRSLAQGIPSGCTASCVCRRLMRDANDATKTVAICIDPARHAALQRAEREAIEQRLEAHYQHLLQRAMQRMIEAGAASNDWSKATALLLRTLLLDSRLYQSGPDRWDLMLPLSRQLGIDLDWDKLRDPEVGIREELELLAGVEPHALLLLGANLLLTSEARMAVRFREPARLLAFVLDESGETQSALDGLEQEESYTAQESATAHSVMEAATEPPAEEAGPHGEDNAGSDNAGLAERVSMAELEALTAPKDLAESEDLGEPQDPAAGEALTDDEAIIAAHEAETAALEEEREHDEPDCDERAPQGLAHAVAGA